MLQRLWKKTGVISAKHSALAITVCGYKSGKKHPKKGASGQSASSSSPRGDGAAGSSLPTSLDISEKEGLIDVEKYFPEAVRHLRSTPRVSEVAENQRARKWHREVHEVNVDGLPLNKPRDETKSFFDQGSLNIRHNARDRSRSLGMDVPTRNEQFSPDILRMTGGNPHEHGVALAESSNAAPADATLEWEEGNRKPSGRPSSTDTPVEITDMLKERLMELKTQKLQEDRYTAYLPKRLHLASDAEVASANMRQHQREKPLLLSSTVRRSSQRAPTTLGDVVTGEEEEGQRSASLMDVTASALADAEAFIQGTSSNVPGGINEAKVARRNAAGAAQGHLRAGAHRREGEVYLLRTLARAGFCSRREAESIVTSGQVRVNNVVERNAFRLVRAEDDIHVVGHHSRLRFAPPRLWMYHKPAHVIVSRHDVAGRTLITKHASILGIDHLVPVGSLPMRAHGVLLLTNDGEMARFLEDPDSMIQQTYLLRVRPAIDPLLAHKFNTKGITVNGRQLRGVEFTVNPSMKSRFSVKVKLRGENVPIYQLMQHIGRTIERGGRMAVGAFSLGQLAVGSIREVTVPPHYMEHSGREWKSFVERDWPYFRRRRVVKLRKLSRYRELTPKEVQELENATYNEIQESFAMDAAELDTSNSYPMSRPVVDIGPIPFGFDEESSNDIHTLDLNDVIQKDITFFNTDTIVS